MNYYDVVQYTIEKEYPGWEYIDRRTEIKNEGTQFRVKSPEGHSYKTCFRDLASLSFKDRFDREMKEREVHRKEQQRRDDEWQLKKRFKKRDTSRIKNEIVTEFNEEEEYHYTYKIICSKDNKYYYGVRGCKGDPNDDIDYMGSGIRIKNHIKRFGLDRFDKEIVSVYKDRELAEFHEIELINEWIHDCDCLNITNNMGLKLNASQKRRIPKIKHFNKDEIEKMQGSFSPPSPNRPTKKKKWWK